MTDDRRLTRRVRAILWAGLVTFWAVQLALFHAGVPLLDSVLLAVLLAAIPAFSLAQLPLLQDAFVERMPAYWGSIVTLWLLGSAGWLVGTRSGGSAAIGVVGIGWAALLGWTSVLTAAGLATILVFRWIARALGVEDTPLLQQLLPRTRAERRVFALLSVAAGVGEEIAYRGYAIPLLAPVLGTGGSALVTSAVFGVVHGYQGMLGVLRTGLMGGVLAWGFLASGSLWPSIVAHTLIDVVAGIVLGERLLSPGSDAGVQRGSTTP